MCFRTKLVSPIQCVKVDGVAKVKTKKINFVLFND